VVSASWFESWQKYVGIQKEVQSTEESKLDLAKEQFKQITKLSAMTKRHHSKHSNEDIQD
jgi:hypothetical protein